MDVLVTIINILVTSVLSALFTAISLRWVFSKISGSISSLTHLGGKIAGEASGNMRATKAVREDLAEGFLGGPNLAGLKMIAGQFGFDIDTMIEEHGAENTLAGIIQILQMVGIDPMKLLSQGLGGITKNLLGGSGTTSSEGLGIGRTT